MCQGAIVSLVKFKKGKKTRRVVLSGVGSHSDLLSRERKKLIKAGWREGCLGEEVISIESDFSGWNRFTVEGGNPGKSDMAILKREYKKIAGNAKTLIVHVKRVGMIDDALVGLLTAPAWAEYNKVTATAWAEYNKVKAPALAEYDKVTAPALAEYDKVKATAWAEYDKVTATAWAEYNKVTATALAEYNKVKAPAWVRLFSAKENRIDCLR